MPVPNTFANATTSIPLSQLDNNFATAITLGNTAIQLGNTVTTLNNMTLANVTISSVAAAITPAQGGTGLTTLTANNVLIGNGTSNVTFVAPGTSGNVLTSNGTVWLSQAVSAGTSISNGNSNVSIASSNGNVTVASAGSSVATFDTSGNFQFNSGYGSVATAYGCRAWVNFNGTGVVSIRASGNVTSITDNGTGLYTVNFTTAMPDSNYSFVATCGVTALGVAKINQSNADPTTSALRLQATDAANAALDTTFTCVAIFR